MEMNDRLDEVLYQTIPSLDLAVLYGQEAQADREPHHFSAGFERRMRRLIGKERRKRRTEERRLKNQELENAHAIEINGMSWFATWREGSCRMARTQKGDVFYWVSGPPELSREELIKILEGIVPADRDVGEMNQEVEDEEEARKIYFGE